MNFINTKEMIKKKILVPVDFSECSKNALRNAINIARRSERDLVLVNAFVVPVTHVEFGGATMIQEIAHDIEHNIKNEFRLLIDQMPELNKVDYEYSMAHGSPSDVIYSSLLEHNIEMIVMGTHGVSGINEILLGSNTYSVIKNVDIPVFVIPETTGVYNFNKIALTSDYGNIDNLNIFNPLIRLVNELHAELDIIHFTTKEVLSDEEINMGRNIENHFKNIRHSYHAAGVTEDFEKAIQEYTIQNNIDLLVMVPRKHNIFDRLFGETSWTRRMVFHTKTPLLILPA